MAFSAPWESIGPTEILAVSHWPEGVTWLRWSQGCWECKPSTVLPQCVLEARGRWLRGWESPSHQLPEELTIHFPGRRREAGARGRGCLLNRQFD